MCCEMCFLRYLVGLRKVWPFIGILTQLCMMLAGVSTTHSSNLQTLLPFAVPCFPYLCNMKVNVHKLLVPKYKMLPTAIIIQRHGHIFYFTHSRGRFNSLTATGKITKTLREVVNAIRAKWSGFSLQMTRLPAKSLQWLLFQSPGKKAH